MLILVGLGLETKDISVRGLQAATEADRVFVEQYTLFVSKEYLDYLKDATGQEIKELGRSDLEEKARETISEAAKENIVILVPGDPLIATTHYATLVGTAGKLGIKCKVIHAPSIYSAAVGESGLDVYRFGAPVTVTYWSDRYKPTSFLDVINSNLRNDRHTLVLLDLEQKEKRPMRLGEAISLLKAAEGEKMLDIINEDLKILVMGDVGRGTQEIVYVKLKDVNRIVDHFDNKVLVLIIPAKLNFAEEEAVSRYIGAK